MEENNKNFDPNSLQDMLKMYYVRLFPHKPFYRWLSYNLCKSKELFPAKIKNNYENNNFS